jgi:hypothetical protein
MKSHFVVANHYHRTEVHKVMIRSALFLIGILALTAQTPAGGHTRHLVYQFGYNTPVASSGNGTGTMAVDITGPVADGGLMISAADHWWNTVRPRATNTCEVYADGRVNCAQRPYAISPMQWTLFPLLGRDYFKGLGPGGTGAWTRSFGIYAAIVPGASGFAGSPSTWKCSYALHGTGLVPNAGHTYLVETTGTLDQEGGTYRNGKSKQRIAYDRTAKIPVVVRDVRTHYPQRSVYNNDLIELKLTKDSGWK